MRWAGSTIKDKIFNGKNLLIIPELQVSYKNDIRQVTGTA